MPIRHCPVCKHDTPRALDEINKTAWVAYYRCPKCTHVWTVPKDDPNALPRPISSSTE